jgi:hypothetical protein
MQYVPPVPALLRPAPSGREAALKVGVGVVAKTLRAIRKETTPRLLQVKTRWLPPEMRDIPRERGLPQKRATKLAMIEDGPIVAESEVMIVEINHGVGRKAGKVPGLLNRLSYV